MDGCRRNRCSLFLSLYVRVLIQNLSYCQCIIAALWLSFVHVKNIHLLQSHFENGKRAFLTMKHNRKTNDSSINCLNQFKFYIYLEIESVPNRRDTEERENSIHCCDGIGFGGCATAALAGDTV